MQVAEARNGGREGVAEGGGVAHHPAGFATASQHSKAAYHASSPPDIAVSGNHCPISNAGKLHRSFANLMHFVWITCEGGGGGGGKRG
jgi:hypothetical protein